MSHLVWPGSEEDDRHIWPEMPLCKQSGPIGAFLRMFLDIQHGAFS